MTDLNLEEMEIIELENLKLKIERIIIKKNTANREKNKIKWLNVKKYLETRVYFCRMLNNIKTGIDDYNFFNFKKKNKWSKSESLTRFIKDNLPKIIYKVFYQIDKIKKANIYIVYIHKSGINGFRHDLIYIGESEDVIRRFGFNEGGHFKAVKRLITGSLGYNHMYKLEKILSDYNFTKGKVIVFVTKGNKKNIIKLFRQNKSDEYTIL